MFSNQKYEIKFGEWEPVPFENPVEETRIESRSVPETILLDAARDFATQVYGPQHADDAALGVKVLLEKGKRYDSGWQRFLRWKEINHSFVKVFFGWWIAITVLGAVIFNIAYWPLRTHANDYGHVDPGAVYGRASDAISDWNSRIILLTDQLGVPIDTRGIAASSKRHSHTVLGKRAWKVMYHTRDGSPLCVWVWSGAKGHYYAIGTTTANCAHN